jgi:hypothetical protein
MTSTILSAVERQLTRYFSAMSQQAEAARLLAEQSRDEIRRELDERLPAAASSGVADVDISGLTERLTGLEAGLTQLNERTAEQRAINEAYQTALQTALEERLGEFANHQHWRMNDIEEKLAALPTGLDSETMIEIRQTVRDDMERSFSSVHARLDDMVNVDKRTDEQFAANVQHQTDALAALNTRIDAGERLAAASLDERFTALQAELTTTFEGVAEQVTDHSTILLGKIEQSESRGVDRMLALEARIAEDLGTKIANLDATIGRVAGGFDDAMIALNQRLLELENKQYEFDDRMGELAERAAKFDETMIAQLRAEMSSAVGEAMLVRIELDRVVTATDEKIDKQSIRMSEMESLLVDQTDVSTAVQLERLDELERQMAMVQAPGGLTAAAAHATSTPSEPDHTASGGTNRSLPSMSLNPRVATTDTPVDATRGTTNDSTRQTESTYSKQ